MNFESRFCDPAKHGFARAIDEPRQAGVCAVDAASSVYHVPPLRRTLCSFFVTRGKPISKYIVKKRLNLSASLYEILQILSLTMFTKIPLDQPFAQTRPDEIHPFLANQLLLFI
ncbi:MAG: hypothetical protein ACRD36_00575 [Candidatus Acidiferrum sp.]